ncbi:MAG: STAS domain-containing protein [Solirubrobacteraceae bacterium]
MAECACRPSRGAAPASGQSELSRRPDAERITVTLSGEIDMAVAPALERELQEAETSGARTIVLDLAGVDFIDSAGLHILIRAQQRADANGYRLVLTGVPAQARRLFVLTGVTELLTTE